MTVSSVTIRVQFLNSSLKDKKPDFFDSLNPRARLTCEKIGQGSKLNWLDNFGTRALEDIIKDRKWSVAVIAYKITLFFHSIIYRNLAVPTGTEIAAIFNPSSKSSPRQPEAVPVPLESAPLPPEAASIPAAGDGEEENSPSEAPFQIHSNVTEYERPLGEDLSEVSTGEPIEEIIESMVQEDNEFDDTSVQGNLSESETETSFLFSADAGNRKT